MVKQGYDVGIKLVRRLMKDAGVKALTPKQNTSRPGKQHRRFPYLLRNARIVRINQAWAANIIYIPMARGSLYLVAIMDLYSRRVLAWQLSNTLDSAFCIEALRSALAKYGRPEIFNTDQGAQFTSEVFLSVLEAENIKISMRRPWPEVWATP